MIWQLVTRMAMLFQVPWLSAISLTHLIMTFTWAPTPLFRALLVLCITKLFWMKQRFRSTISNAWYTNIATNICAPLLQSPCVSFPTLNNSSLYWPLSDPAVYYAHLASNRARAHEAQGHSAGPRGGEKFLEKQAAAGIARVAGKAPPASSTGSSNAAESIPLLPLGTLNEGDHVNGEVLAKMRTGMWYI